MGQWGDPRRKKKKIFFFGFYIENPEFFFLPSFAAFFSRKFRGVAPSYRLVLVFFRGVAPSYGRGLLEEAGGEGREAAFRPRSGLCGA